MNLHRFIIHILNVALHDIIPSPGLYLLGGLSVSDHLVVCLSITPLCMADLVTGQRAAHDLVEGVGLL